MFGLDPHRIPLFDLDFSRRQTPVGHGQRHQRPDRDEPKHSADPGLLSGQNQNTNIKSKLLKVTFPKLSF
jgi:hypothetical protein